MLLMLLLLLWWWRVPASDDILYLGDGDGIVGVERVDGVIFRTRGDGFWGLGGDLRCVRGANGCREDGVELENWCGGGGCGTCGRGPEL